MENSNKWFEFMNFAQTLFLKGQAIDDYKQNIQIAIEPSLDNSVFLQLVLTDQQVLWYRTTWERLTDAPKFSDPIERLKYIGQTIKPTIRYESGATDKEELKDILDFAKTLSIKPNIEKWGGIILDGIFYTMTIGVENTRVTYKWNHLPESWMGLAKLTAMLEKLNKKL